MNEDTPAITLQPHQQRVVDEKVELDLKLFALDRFIEKNALFQSACDVPEQDRLRAQRLHMSSYSIVLAARIAAFHP